MYSYYFLAHFLENRAKVRKPFANTYRELVEFVIKVSFNVEIAKYTEEIIIEVLKVYNP